jgi:hypothetical protein
MNMCLKFKVLAAVSAIGLGFASSANAANVLIVQEGATSASQASVFTGFHNAAGNTTTVTSTFPVSTAGFDQIWDIRFTNASALTAPQIATYASFLAGGGGVFLMGENAVFATRNTSLLVLISQAGGGSLTFQNSPGSQTVFAPFTGPVPVASIGPNIVSLPSPGGVTSFGSGQWISANGGVGAGVFWGKGSLANASSGYLGTYFDSNIFATTAAPLGGHALAQNLIAEFNRQGALTSVVPEPATWAMMIMGFGLIGGALRSANGRRRRMQRASGRSLSFSI